MRPAPLHRMERAVHWRNLPLTGSCWGTTGPVRKFAGSMNAAAGLIPDPGLRGGNGASQNIEPTPPMKRHMITGDRVKLEMALTLIAGYCCVALSLACFVVAFTSVG